MQLVDDPASADLRLSGTIDYIDTAPTAFNSVAEPTQYSYLMAVDAKLEERGGKVIWSTQGFGDTQSYAEVPQAAIVTSPLFLQQNLRAQDIQNLPDAAAAATQLNATQDQVMGRIARDLYANMSEGF